MKSSKNLSKNNHRLQLDSEVAKLRHKMYKSGKLWLFAGLTSISLGLGFGAAIDNVNADTADGPATDNTNQSSTGSGATIVIGSTASSTTAAQSAAPVESTAVPLTVTSSTGNESTGVTVSGTTQPGAQVSVFDATTGATKIATADANGHYEVKFSGAEVNAADSFGVLATGVDGTSSQQVKGTFSDDGAATSSASSTTATSSAAAESTTVKSTSAAASEDVATTPATSAVSSTDDTDTDVVNPISVVTGDVDTNTPASTPFVAEATPVEALKNATSAKDDPTDSEAAVESIAATLDPSVIQSGTGDFDRSNLARAEKSSGALPVAPDAKGLWGALFVSGYTTQPKDATVVAGDHVTLSADYDVSIVDATKQGLGNLASLVTIGSLGSLDLTYTLYKSTDGWKTYQEVTSNSSGQFDVVATDASTEYQIGAGIKTDGGWGDWLTFGLASFFTNAIAGTSEIGSHIATVVGMPVENNAIAVTVTCPTNYLIQNASATYTYEDDSNTSTYNASETLTAHLETQDKTALTNTIKWSSSDSSIATVD